MGIGSGIRAFVRRFTPSRQDRVRHGADAHHRHAVSRGDRQSCPRCGKSFDEHQLALNLFVCPHCGYHYRLGTLERARVMLDGGEINQFGTDGVSGNPIGFPGYDQKILEAQRKSGVDEAAVSGVGRIEGHTLAVAFMSFRFMGGSMGTVVGERITRALLYAAEHELPCLICTASGGARMQEGIFSLMQMAKTSHAAALLAARRLPLFVLLTDPTTGGVSASFAMLGDVTLAEPDALIGFAGPRVIEGTIRQKLPSGFQRSEFQRSKGFVDIVVERKDLRSTLAYLIETHMEADA